MNIKLEYVGVDELVPYDKNARLHEDYDVSQIAKSIEKYGFNDPIGVWKGNVIIEGHGRLEAAKTLGLKEVPIIRLDHLTDKERREYAIMHNKTAELSKWDFDALSEEMADIDLSGFNVDFDFLNFSPDDFNEDFQLPSGDKPEICQMTFTLHQAQKELIEKAIESVTAIETFGNTNKNGNALYEVVRQWEEQKKLS